MKNEARHWDEIGREKAARKAGTFRKMDQTDLSKDPTMGILQEVERQHPTGSGGTALERYPIRPPWYKVFARRRSAWESAKAAGIAIPELLDRPRGQQTGVLYDVLAVGPGVTTVKVGDVVIANCLQGRDMGAILADGVWMLDCDCDYVDTRTHETERAPDGSTWHRRMSDTERGSGGHVLAIVEGLDSNA